MVGCTCTYAARISLFSVPCRRGGGGAGPSGSQQPGGAAATDRERERELELIKQQYLGQDKLKKRVGRRSSLARGCL